MNLFICLFGSFINFTGKNENVNKNFQNDSENIIICIGEKTNKLAP